MAKHMNIVGGPCLEGALGLPTPLNPALSEHASASKFLLCAFSVHETSLKIETYIFEPLNTCDQNCKTPTISSHLIPFAGKRRLRCQRYWTDCHKAHEVPYREC